MRAVQRKVFPGGNNQYFPPDISPADKPAAGPGTPATPPIADVEGRQNATEAQQARMTGQIEQLENRLRMFADAFEAYKRSTGARLTALEQTASSIRSSGAIEPAGAAAEPARPVPPRAASTSTSTSPARPKADAATPASAAADPGRARLVAAVARPLSDDPAEDGYVYGYRLWQAKLYPEAEGQLKQVVSKYPSHRRASWAQNLLGRTYLDEGKPSLASLAFYDGYKKFPNGERAPDSLYFLSVALKKLGKPSADICQVYDELSEVYASKITATMKADVARGRAEEKCKAG